MIRLVTNDTPILAEKAHKTYEEIVGLRKNINESFWDLVANLKMARENRHWAILGHESWGSYLAQAEIDLAESTVDKYLTIYNSIKATNLLEHVQVNDIVRYIDIGKLAIIAPKLTQENAQELIHKAAHLSRTDLRREISETPIIQKDIPKSAIILADPPWRYEFSQTLNREIENQYPTLDVEQICQMKVPHKEDSILFLWATAPKLLEALMVCRSWGFDYKTHAIWDKVTIGMGYWFRGQHELLLVATKGNVSPPPEDKRIGSIIRHKREEHSRKPQLIYDLIESWYPNSTYLEIFARNKREGWSSWGNEV